MRALDLCCGLGGMTEAMQAEGFSVLGYDVEPSLADLYPGALRLQDVRTVDPARLPAVDWLHASPPCQRFSTARASRKTDPATEADLDVLDACLRIRDHLKPRFWTIENVVGSIPLFSTRLGKPSFRNGPYVFWGNFPAFLVGKERHRKGLAYVCRNGTGTVMWKTPKRGLHRAKVPKTIAGPMARAIALELRPFAFEEVQK